MTHSWFKLVTVSRTIVAKENVALSTVFRALSLPKKNILNFTSNNDIYKSNDIHVIN
jgi:hypothetical protein